MTALFRWKSEAYNVNKDNIDEKLQPHFNVIKDFILKYNISNVSIKTDINLASDEIALIESEVSNKKKK